MTEEDFYDIEETPLGCVYCYDGWWHGCCDDLCRGSNEAQDCDRAIPCSNCNPLGDVML